VKALYLHLREHSLLLYEYERAFDPFTNEQQVRLPSATARENRGTCIDLVILFLSCLANAKLWPIYIQIVQGQIGHALAATWLREPEPRRFDVPAHSTP